MAARHVTTRFDTSLARARWPDVSSAGGFALLEVSMAALLLGITIIGISLMFSVGQGLIVGEGDNRVAVFLAQQRLEQFRALGFENVALATTDVSGNTLTSGQIVENPVSTSSGYRRTTSIVCPREDNYSVICTLITGFGCPSTAPLCPTTYGTRLIVVTVDNVPDATTNVVDRATRPITLRSVLVRR